MIGVFDSTCTLGVLTFSAFTDIKGNLTAADINVVPLPDRLRFDFSLSTASQNVTEKSFNFSYDVAAPLSLYNAYLTFTGQGTDPGVTARVTENVGPTLLVEQTGGSGFANDGTNTPAAYTPLDVANVTVTDTALVSTIATANVRSASISSLTNTFLPEPGTWGLMALGAFGLIARRRWGTLLP